MKRTRFYPIEIKTFHKVNLVLAGAEGWEYGIINTI